MGEKEILYYKHNYCLRNKIKLYLAIKKICSQFSRIHNIFLFFLNIENNY